MDYLVELIETHSCTGDFADYTFPYRHIDAVAFEEAIRVSDSR